MALKVGGKAPLFKLRDQDGRVFDLKKEIGKDIILFAFYPGDFTSVCTKELVCFRDDYSQFQELNCRVVGISTDGEDEHKKFQSKYEFPFQLLSDPDAEVSALYGVKLPLVKKANRAIYIIDKKGVIAYAYVEKLPMFKRENAELLAVLESLK